MLGGDKVEPRQLVIDDVAVVFADGLLVVGPVLAGVLQYTVLEHVLDGLDQRRFVRVTGRDD